MKLLNNILLFNQAKKKLLYFRLVFRIYISSKNYSYAGKCNYIAYKLFINFNFFHVIEDLLKIRFYQYQ